MTIASKRALDDMDIAAELRAQGATLDAIAQVLGRDQRLLSRRVGYYAAGWERLLKAAAQHAAQ